MPADTLYLCEKPDQAKFVARALGGERRGDGFFECDGGAVVTWAYGHLYEPKMPEDYNPDWKAWAWESLPFIPSPFEFQAREGGGAGRQIKVIAGLFRRAAKIVVATDADREGELIAYEILVQLGWRGPVERLWMSDLTLAAVKKALARLKPGAETRPLYHAALARCCADWLVGINMTRATTLKLREGRGKPLSIGRVQTPVLALIVHVEREIRNFKPEDYYELVAHVRAAAGVVKMRFQPVPEKRVKDPLQAERLRRQAEGATGPIRVKTEDKTAAPPPLFDLNLLQQAANARYGWSADKTLEVAQALYEAQAVTYPRTDSTALPEEHRQNVQAILGHVTRLSALAHLKPLVQAPVLRGSVYDDAKVSSHHAIVPTLQPTDPATLGADEAKLYLLICRHYAAAHMPDYEYKSTTAGFLANGVPFLARGQQPIKAGWKEAFGASEDAADVKDDDKEAEADAPLPPLVDGEPGRAEKVEVDAKKTKPPSRFTEKTLLAAMKNIAAFVEDAAAKARLKQTSGIGTAATRGNIIKTLKARDYVVVEKRRLTPTEIGMALIGAIEEVVPSYADAVETARWEDVLEAIAEKKASTRDFVDAIAEKVRKDLATLKERHGLTRIAGGTARPAAPPGRPGAGGGAPRGWRSGLAEGTPLKVAYEQRERAKTLGAKWDAERRLWIAPKGADLEAFRRAGFLG